MRWLLASLFLVSFLCRAIASDTLPYLHPVHFTFTVKDGLNSNFITDLFNDSRGLLWIGTQNGLNTFDGQQIKTVDFSQVNESFVAKICEATDGTIWFTTLGGNIYTINNGKAFPHPVNTYFRDHSPWNLVPSDLIAESSEKIYLSSNQGLFKIQGGELERMAEEGQASGFFTTFQGNLLGFTRAKENVIIHFFDRPYGISGQEISGLPSYEANTNQSFAIAHQGNLYLMMNEQYEKWYVEERISNSLFFENDTTLWLGTVGNGVYKIQQHQIKARLFPQYDIHAVIKDFEGGFWLGTENNGLIYIPCMDITYKNIDPSGVSKVINISNYQGQLAGISDQLALFTYKGIGTPFKPQKKINGCQLHQMGPQQASYISVDYTNSNGFYGLVDWDQQNIKPLHQLSNGIRRLCTKQNDFLVTNYGSLFWYQQQGQPLVLIDQENISRINQITPVKHTDNFWLTTVSGLVKIQLDREQKNIAIKEQIPADRGLKHLFQLGPHQLLTSYDDHLHYWDSVNNSISRLAHLEKSDVWTFYPLDKQRVLLGTAEGLQLLAIHPPYAPEEIQLQNVYEAYGLPRWQVNDIEIIGDTIFCLSELGIVSVPKPFLESLDQRKGRMTLRRVLVNGKEWVAKQVLSIQNDESIVFELSMSSFKDRKNYFPEFRLLPIENDWTQHFSNTLSFYQLPAEDYTLQVRDQYHQVINYRFEVRNYFYQEWWFLLLGVLSLATLVALPFYTQSRFQIAKANLESEKNKWQLRLLTSQLKPHFIFNVLSSIQAFILQNNQRASSDYLAHFASYIRHALVQSRHDSISLAQALESSRNYLQLERMRLDGRFDFDIHIDPKVPIQTIKIPVLLLQPYVENAVIHGMTDIDYPGKISITIQQIAPHTLLCIIRDNGKGLQTHQDTKTTKGHGLGTRINQDRIRLLNALKKHQYDLHLRSNAPSPGLSVEIKIRLDHEIN
ncbi:MAG: histidine kinase [Bacteroidota bacterium]